MRRFGFTIIELLTVVAILGLLAVVAIPNVVTIANTGKGNQCAANLRAIETAKGAYAGDHPGAPSASADVLLKYMPGRSAFPVCPLDDVPYVNATNMNAITVCPHDDGNKADGKHDLNL